jgi:small subunit ribosomal protein S4
VNVPSYRCRVGDIIEVREASRGMLMVMEAAQSPERDVPDYLDVDHNKMKCTFLRIPQLNDVPYPVRMEPNLVVEYYSR